MTLVAPNVRPWNPPRNAMIPGRPVTRRASLSAPSIASEPELRNMTESSGSGNVAASAVGELRDRRGEPDRVDRADQPVDLGVDRGSDPRVGVAEGGDRDPVGEVEVGPAVRVEQAVALAVAPRPLEIAPEDGGQLVLGERGVVGGGVGGHASDALLACGVGRVRGLIPRGRPRAARPIRDRRPRPAASRSAA